MTSDQILQPKREESKNSGRKIDHARNKDNSQFRSIFALDWADNGGAAHRLFNFARDAIS